MIRFTCERIQLEIDEKAILYIETRRNGTILHTIRSAYSTRRAIGEWETILNRRGVMRCHEGYVVNLRHVTLVEHQEAVLENGERIPVSRRRKTALLKAVFISREKVSDTPLKGSESPKILDI